MESVSCDESGTRNTTARIDALHSLASKYLNKYAFSPCQKLNHANWKEISCEAKQGYTIPETTYTQLSILVYKHESFEMRFQVTFDRHGEVGQVVAQHEWGGNWEACTARAKQTDFDYEGVERRAREMCYCE